MEFSGLVKNIARNKNLKLLEFVGMKFGHDSWTRISKVIHQILLILGNSTK